MINAELTWVSAELFLTRGGIKSSLGPMFEIKVRANGGFVVSILTAFGNLPPYNMLVKRIKTFAFKVYDILTVHSTLA